jgi:hypothetical protein
MEQAAGKFNCPAALLPCRTPRKTKGNNYPSAMNLNAAPSRLMCPAL